jgi:oxalate decarboxylase/phosphoglucose isomerase-like protein (cupin superfamily)
MTQQQKTPAQLSYLTREQTASFLLGFISGFVDIACYLALFGLFSANMTGNVLLAAVALVQPQGNIVASRIVAVPVFILGVVIGWAITAYAKRKDWRVQSILLTGEAVALVVFLVMGLIYGPRLQNSNQQLLIITTASFALIAMALVEVEPGGMRELHWHPNADEWQYYLSGRGRMSVFSANKARTFDYQAGDVRYVPFALGHYIENTGDETLRFLEMFRSSYFADLSLNQWMALTTPSLVQHHLNLNSETMASLSKEKPVIVKTAR